MDLLVDRLVWQQQLVKDLQGPGAVPDRFQRHGRSRRGMSLRHSGGLEREGGLGGKRSGGRGGGGGRHLKHPKALSLFLSLPSLPLLCRAHTFTRVTTGPAHCCSLLSLLADYLSLPRRAGLSKMGGNKGAAVVPARGYVGRSVSGWVKTRDRNVKMG